MKKSDGRNVYTINDGEKSWVYAKNEKEAIKIVKKVMNLGEEENYKDSVIGISILDRKEWKKHRVMDTEINNSLTFDKIILASKIINGKEVSFYIAGTMFN